MKKYFFYFLLCLPLFTEAHISLSYNPFGYDSEYTEEGSVEI
jgi:hypothetical protein